MAKQASAPPMRDDSWACETLPLAVRRELLERELQKLGFRKHGHAAQQEAEAGSHPQADDAGRDGHGG